MVMLDETKFPTTECHLVLNSELIIKAKAIEVEQNLKVGELKASNG